MNRFIAIATEFNALNLVSLKALRNAGDEVLVLADPHAGAHGRGERLQQAVRAWPGIAVREHRPPD